MHLMPWHMVIIASNPITSLVPLCKNYSFSPKNKLATSNFSHYYVWMKGNFINRVSSWPADATSVAANWIIRQFTPHDFGWMIILLPWQSRSSFVNPWILGLLRHNILTLFKSWFISKSTKFTFDIFHTFFAVTSQVSSPHIFHQLK